MKIVISKNDMPLYFFALSQIGLLFALYGAALSRSQANSIGVWLIFISAVGIVYLGNKNYRRVTGEIFDVLVLLALALISMLASGWMSYQCFVSLFSFLEVPLFILFTKPFYSGKRIRISCLFAIASTVLYVYLYFSPRSHSFMSIYGERTINDLTLGFSNPNETGMHLISTLIVLVSCIFIYKSKIYRMVLISCSLVLIYFITLTLSRASILVTGLFLVLLIPTAIRKSIPKWFQLLCFLSPIVALFFTAMFTGFFSTYTLFGEVLDTGRTMIYLTRIRGLTPIQYFIGNYKYLFQNSLNAYISVFITVGLPALIIYLKVLYHGIKNCRIFAKNTYNYIAFLGFIILFIQGAMESANFVSGSFYAASFFSIYVIAIDNHEIRAKSLQTSESNVVINHE